MGTLAQGNFNRSMEALLEKDSARIQEITENEGIINYLNQQITEYLVKNKCAGPRGQ